jgi:hypothetical protein
MKRRDPDLEPELAALLEHRSIDRQAPPDLRARVLARARATIAAGEAIAPPPLRPLPASPPRGVALRRGFRIALVASFAIAGAAVGAVGARQASRRGAPPMTSPATPVRVPTVSAPSSGDATTEPGTAPGPAQPSTPHRPTRTASKGDPFSAELALLQSAHGAYTGRDFSNALALIAEHARRFPKGRLAEQREALRVRSLVGAGRADEARRAAAAFAVQFPRSVLLPRLEETARARE